VKYNCEKGVHRRSLADVISSSNGGSILLQQSFIKRNQNLAKILKSMNWNTTTELMQQQELTKNKMGLNRP